MVSTLESKSEEVSSYVSRPAAVIDDWKKTEPAKRKEAVGRCRPTGKVDERSHEDIR
jgi:hypothetical protein